VWHLQESIFTNEVFPQAVLLQNMPEIVKHLLKGK